MHPLAAPGTLWVLSRVGKYLVRPQADETSHKKQISCRRRETGLPSFSRITKDFASAEATRGLSARPLDPFGAHPYIRGRNLHKKQNSLRKAGNGPTFLFPVSQRISPLRRRPKGFPIAPWTPSGPTPIYVGETSHNKQFPCGRQETDLPFFSRIAKDFASAEATKGLSDRPLETFGPFNSHLPCNE